MTEASAVLEDPKEAAREVFYGLLKLEHWATQEAHRALMVLPYMMRCHLANDEPGELHRYLVALGMNALEVARAAEVFGIILRRTIDPSHLKRR